MSTRIQTARPDSLLDIGLDRLVALCRALDYDEASTRLAGDVFSELAVGWGSSLASSSPRWRSHITDDETPFEFSLAIAEGEPELRFLTEAQGVEPSLDSNWQAAEALNRTLATLFDLDL